ncbi:nuclear transport factor 2 family protein [Seongchinamella unica]|uniref:Nuclear transport factor 2 family protein n=1 Tax=Seongchinamella unica TaxID=2547392 RepID=A0A4R5LMS7_9GAMM|nr:nuclear transport factor 2 family protein [Seongchinamella unica]TDG11372.1 nuclear transport factor 2 family protein [Seongchinamella unica]
MQTIDVVRGVYEGFGNGDIPAVLELLADDCSWTEAAGGPYGGVYVGPQAILDGVFMKLGDDWNGFTAMPQDFVADGDRVVVLGEYSGSYKATGRSFRSPFAHAWTVKDGKAVRFQQYVDTVLHREPMD